MKQILISISIALFILTIGFTGCFDLESDDKYYYEYKLVIKAENNEPYYVLLPIIAKYHDEDKSKVLSDLRFEQGSGNFLIERVDGRYINVSSDQDIILSCRGKTSEFAYHPATLQLENKDVPVEKNESKNCYVFTNSKINITLNWYSKEPCSLINQIYTGVFNQSGWYSLNATYGEQYVL